MSDLMPPEQAIKGLEKYVSNLEENILCTIALQPTMAPAKAKNLIAKTAETYALKNILEALKQLLQEEGKKIWRLHVFHNSVYAARKWANNIKPDDSGPDIIITLNDTTIEVEVKNRTSGYTTPQHFQQQ
ncbi:MAG: hypothetical protein ACP5K8_08690 [Nitrososphaeria archaeon]